MPAHLLVLYPKPMDVEEFDRAYREEHLSLAGPKLEGATGVMTKRVVGPAFAPPPDMVCILQVTSNITRIP